MSIAALLSYALHHPIAKKHPLRTLFRIAAWQARARLKPGLHEVAWVNGAKLVAQRGMTGATGNIYFGLHEASDMAFIAHLLRPDEIFVDAGANIGSYSVLAGVVSGATVHAFEPAEETLPTLRRNLSINRIKAEVHPVALTAENGPLRFTVGRDTVNQVSSTGEVVAEGRTLDSFDLEPVAIKADLEGHELAMLKGAAKTLASERLLAVEIESAEPEASEIMQAAGFQRRWYDPIARELLTTPYPANNSLFVRNIPEVEKRLKSGPEISWSSR